MTGASLWEALGRLLEGILTRAQKSPLWTIVLISLHFAKSCAGFRLMTPKLPVVTHTSRSAVGAESLPRPPILSPTDGSPPIPENLPPPADPTANPEDEGFRRLRKNWPLWLQYFLRDSGALRALVDLLVLLGIPSLLRQYPGSLKRFLHLSGLVRLEGLPEIKFDRVSHGPDRKQFIDIIEPVHPVSSESGTGSLRREVPEAQHFVVFVHGGAWGSGFPSMYRLVVQPFIERGMGAAVVGYRTYPTGNVWDQVRDVQTAVRQLCAEREVGSVSLVGHSSGAHISALAVLEGLPEIERCVWLSGVFDIANHYQFESGRGVERISPLAPACGGSLSRWKAASPTRLLSGMRDGMSQTDTDRRLSLPPTLLCHGVLDSTVPYTSSVQFVEELKVVSPAADLLLLEETGHAQTVLELMFGGPLQHTLVEWITKRVPN
uniref:BD-FAE-like domain-containing protein n=1 Tax=Chromera velia CCMP2878 TaxID=1169474 RepID=A0A0G4HAQ4_9ALVE|eukprot:Cvel_25746.t1-p1 / transcript=Cvel_25746.t1 / gene=Cvel_25746 / organism=Chromera_velia_CCMP2878 / gene_product=Probable isoprenylcysteine alpha-carbonyl, putative / transcript_product=Probable isoprenylcysteine alpha-carbonyl, putative / location=Cvel_scaffold2962:18399-19697(+) / protein_length=433 / sequence_SO=supercontig / SO=protein_coding / is_pseudo=false